MAYSAAISPLNPTCFLFLIDQSGSMEDSFDPKIGMRRAEFVAEALNRLLYNLMISCTRDEKVQNYFHISVLGYGAAVQPALAGPLSGRVLVPIAELANTPARMKISDPRMVGVDNERPDPHTQFPVWLEPAANGGTSMCQALEFARGIVERWVLEHPDGFPPTILHLTDGQPTDGDPTKTAQRIMTLRTSDGEVLLFTCHISSSWNLKFEFPSSDTVLPGNFARMLFSISSPLPEHSRHSPKEHGDNLGEGARGFILNSDPASVFRFFEVGTKHARKMLPIVRNNPFQALSALDFALSIEDDDKVTFHRKAKRLDPDTSAPASFRSGRSDVSFELQAEGENHALEEGFHRAIEPLRKKISLEGVTSSSKRELEPSSKQGLSPPSPQLSGPSPQLPDGVRVDKVHFSLTAPTSLAPACKADIYFWAHIESQRESVIRRAREALGLFKHGEMVIKSHGPIPLVQGTIITVRVAVEGMSIPEDCKAILWSGEIGAAGFVIEVPPGAAKGSYAGFASIRIGGAEIARMDFVLNVNKVARKIKRLRTRLRKHKKAFASYASQDRDQVLARVQGMQKVMPSLDVFLDVINLRSGQSWEQELLKEIPRNDVFYLFWSQNAMSSAWVDKEWRCAYNAKGEEFIDPVPLEYAPPPPELSNKHFSDPLLVHLR